MGSTTPPPPSLPYWQINVPPHLRTEECPAFLSLKTLSQKDLGIVSTLDSQYTTLTWPTIKQFITNNNLDLFQRRPSDLRRYLEYIWWIRHESPYAESRGGGGVVNFMLEERLHWDLKSWVSREGKEGRETRDGHMKERWTLENVKVLCNDWPYGVDERVVHLVVWTKFELEDDPRTGDHSCQARHEIEEYVQETFIRSPEGCDRDDVIWFKNWKALKSVHAIEHFHVMLYDPDPSLIERATGGDVPLSKRQSGWCSQGSRRW